VAKDTLAGTRVRTELKDVGSAVQVVTAKFLQDTNSKNSSDLLVYTTSTEVAGQGGNFTGGGDGAIIDTTGYTSPNPNTRVRGLAAADNLRDFFLTDIPWDSYNVGRVDLQRGPNSILFGIGSPAGIINSSVNTAMFKDANKVEVQFNDQGSYRGTFDFNKVLLKNELSIRFAGLYDNTEYKQKPAFRDDHRYFGTIKYDPKIFNINGAHTSFRANYESGDINGNNPRLLPPMDNITPWFQSAASGGLGKATYTTQNSNNVTSPGNAAYSPWIGAAGNRIWDGNVTTFATPDTSTQGISFGADVKNYPTGQPEANNNTVNGSYKGIVTYDSWAFNSKQPGYGIKPYKAKSMTDASVFDFYNNLIEGPNKKNWTKFDAYSLNLAQTFFNNKLGFEMAYDKQDTKWGYRNFVSYDAASIAVDVMSTLIDGSANPNVGKAMLIGGGGSAGSGQTHNIRETIRFTSFGEFDFKDVLAPNSKLAAFLGKHSLTYSRAQQSKDSTPTGWNNWFVGSGYGPTAAASVGQASRDDITITYLSGNLSGSSLSGANLKRLTAIQEPKTTTIKQWDTVSRSFKTYDLPIVNANDPSFTDDTRPYTQARKTKEVINSDVFVWQGYFFDGNIVPMVGWRRDVAEAYDAGTPNKVGGLVTNYTDPEWRLPSGLIENGTGKNKERMYNIVDGQTHTWSIVGHAPKSWMKNLPWGLGASVFYNESENFQPDASRKDILGGNIPSPTGHTKDAGFAITALDGKLMLRVTKYETRVTNATLSGELGNSYLIGAGEAWGQAAAYHLKVDDNQWPGDGNYGTASNGKTLRWQPNDAGLTDPTQGYNPTTNPYTQKAIDAQYAIQVASVNDWFAHQIPVSMQNAWGMAGYATGSGNWSMNSVAVTGDTLSKGTEFEIAASPIPGLELSINFSKTDAQRLNIAKAYSDWIDQRVKDYAGPMGDMRMWGNGNWIFNDPTGTVRGKFDAEVIPNYKLALALNNSSVPELRPWRFNTVANYSFHDGKFKGANVGLGWRYEDKQVTGFKLNAKKDGYDVNQRYYGSTENHIDLWIGYSHKISQKLNWRIQLNVRDLFATKDLIPITVQPDGSPGAYRIPEPRTINLTNTFDF
jgi:hypothetical protein